MPCKACDAQRATAKNAKRESKARNNARRRERYASDPVYRAKVQAAGAREEKRAADVARERERIATDPSYRAKRNAERRKWLAGPKGKANLAKRRARRAAWAATHRGRMIIRLNNEKRRARMLSVDDGLTPTQWIAICNAFGCCCAYCGNAVTDQDTEMDHVVPIVRGGRHGPCNIAPACERCNAKKKDKPVNVFLKVHGLNPTAVAERFALALQRLGEAA